MNALNEVNKVITNVTYTPHRHIDQDEEYLTPEKMAVSKNFFFLIMMRNYNFIYVFIFLNIEMD